MNGLVMVEFDDVDDVMWVVVVVRVVGVWGSVVRLMMRMVIVGGWWSGIVNFVEGKG